MSDFRAAKDIPSPGPGEAKLRIDCFGKASVVYAGNLLIGRGVRSVEFRQEAEKPATVTIECDVEQLGFSIIEHEESASDSGVPKAEKQG